MNGADAAWLDICDRAAAAPAEAEFARPFLLEDMAAMLVAASSRPPRIRQADGALYVRDQERFEAELPPLVDDPRLAGRLDGIGSCGAVTRVYVALHALGDLGLFRYAVRGRATSYEPKPEARDWLGWPAAARLRSVLEPARRQVVAFGDASASPVAGSAAAHDSPSPSVSIFASGSGGLAWPEPAAVCAIVDAFGSLPDDGTVPLADFLRYHAPRIARVGADGYRIGLNAGVWAYRPATLEEREQWWIEILAAVALHGLLPLGGVSLGIRGGDELSVGLTSIGRYLLGLADDFDDSALGNGGSGGAVVVQPDFEVVFVSPSPAAEAEIARFAERIGRGVGAVFRITRESIFAAAAAGLTAESVLDMLRRYARDDVPPNVVREIAGWVGRLRRATVRTAVLVDCPDEETAVRVAAAAGKAKARRVAPSIVELVDTRGRPALERKLAGAGIVLDDEPAV